MGRAWDIVLARTWVRRSGKREVRVALRLDGVDEADDDDDREGGSDGRCSEGSCGTAAGSSWAAATLSDEAGAPETTGSACGGGLWCWRAGGAAVDGWEVADESESAGGGSAVLIDI